MFISYFQCDKVKVIVTLFSYSSDFALYFEDYFMY